VYKNPFAMTTDQIDQFDRELEVRKLIESKLVTPIVENNELPHFDLVQARIELEKKKKQDKMLKEISEKARQYDLE